ncbi:MAG TPA: universal stress protein [Flavisolibacter sp.]|nr:universal stress protein [Flavisolibacter sp.]
MKKLLLVADGTNYSTNAFDFVRQLNELEKILVAGIFVPQVDYANLWSYAAAAGAGAVYVPLLEPEENDDVEQNILRFQEQCEMHKISFRVHKDFYEFALPALKKESRFADAMVISGDLFYKQFNSANQFDYMQTALHEAECPVLIVPEEMQFPESNIIAYDGSAEAVYALKQFAYIFPELARNKTLLVYADTVKNGAIPSRELIVELASQLYPDLTLLKLDAAPKKSFSSWVSEQKASLLVSGSFGRSSVSQIFRKSFVADIILQHQLPVFVAHR